MARHKMYNAPARNAQRSASAGVSGKPASAGRRALRAGRRAASAGPGPRRRGRGPGGFRRRRGPGPAYYNLLEFAEAVRRLNSTDFKTLQAILEEDYSGLTMDDVYSVSMEFEDIMLADLEEALENAEVETMEQENLEIDAQYDVDKEMQRQAFLSR